MSTRAQTISRNFTILSGGQIVSRLFAFAVTLRLAYVLPVDRFGVIVFATSALLYAGLVTDCGFNLLGPLEVSRRTIPVHDLVRSILGLRLVLAALTIAVIGPMIWLLPVAGETRVILLLYALSLLISALDVAWVFLGAELMRPVVSAEIASQTAMALGVFVFVTGEHDTTRIPLIFIAAQAIAATLLLGAFVRRFGWIRPGIDLALVKRLLPAALPLNGSAAVGQITSNLDLILLGIVLGSAASGLYGAAYRVVWMPTVVAVAFYTVLRPTLARAAIHGFQSIDSLLQRVLRLAMAAGIGISVGSIVLAAPIVDLLYGQDYHEAILPLQILLIAFALVVISRIYRALLVAFHHQPVEFRVMFTAAMLNIAMNVVLIPTFGLIGAALATLISEGLLFLLLYNAASRLIQPVPLVKHITRPVICAVPLALVLGATGALPLFMRASLGAGVYVSMLILLRVVDGSDVRLILGAWRPKLPMTKRVDRELSVTRVADSSPT